MQPPPILTNPTCIFNIVYPYSAIIGRVAQSVYINVLIYAELYALIMLKLYLCVVTVMSYYGFIHIHVFTRYIALSQKWLLINTFDMVMCGYNVVYLLYSKLNVLNEKEIMIVQMLDWYLSLTLEGASFQSNDPVTIADIHND